jgi:histidinol-phosphate aminotransferase
MNTLWSKQLDTLTPYEAGEQPQDKSYIKLNTNENPYPPSDKVLEAIRNAADGDLRLYPDPYAQRLKQAVADFYAIDTTKVFVGNGSDEVLGFAFQAFFKKNDPLQFPDITYSFYPAYCRLFGIEYRTFPVTDTFEIDTDLIPDDCAGTIIANPNAPTGISLEREQIEAILTNNKQSVVIIDEAYVDFGAESCVPLINQYDNLMVIQTLSKSRALAGLRVGIAMADPGLIEGIERVKNSFNAYPLDRLAIAGATVALEDTDQFELSRQMIIEAREWSASELKKLSFYVIPSKANFIMIQHKNESAGSLYLKLKERGILVRHFDRPRIDNFLRVTIGTMEQMQILLRTLQDILG